MVPNYDFLTRVLKIVICGPVQGSGCMTLVKQSIISFRNVKRPSGNLVQPESNQKPPSNSFLKLNTSTHLPKLDLNPINLYKL